MSWTAAEFLELIEQRGIMCSDHVDQLRDQLAAAGCEVHVVHVARKLVEAGYLNPYFAKTLLEEGYRHRIAGMGAAIASSAQSRQETRAQSSQDDELGLAPLEEEQREEQAALAAGPPIDLRIELPPISDPDAWPTADAPLLPAANPQSAFGALTRISADAQSKRRRSQGPPWIIWALSGAVAVLVLIVIALLARG